MKIKLSKIQDLFYILKDNSSQNILFPPATVDELKELEQELGVQLPETYRQFLMLTNGADLYESETIYGTKDGYNNLQVSVLTVMREIVAVSPNLVPFHFGNIYSCFDVAAPNTQEYPILKYTLKGQRILTGYKSFTHWLSQEIISNYE